VGSEIQRASDADRERYVNHLSFLFSEGYIRTRAEADEFRDRLLEARSLSTLNNTLSGFPQPPVPEQPRDWGIPERWVPATVGLGFLGVLIAAVPTTALAHHGDTVSNALTATFFVTGMMIVIAAIIIACCAACSWDNAGQMARERRRSLDRNRRIRDRAN
jgi:DUF1707 SHOCT-like domain